MEYARNGRNRRAYRRKAARLQRTADPVCWICEQDIDRSLPPTHAKSWTADHETPLSLGGHVLGPLKPAHRDCNASRGGSNRIQTPADRPTSRRW